MSTSKVSFKTDSIWAGPDPEEWAHWDVMPPICVSSIFKLEASGRSKLQDYSRNGNPTRSALEKTLARLDEGKFGLVFTSGMGAIVTVINLLSSGDHIVCVEDLYPGTSSYLNEVASRMKISTTYVDATNPDNISKALKDNTKLVWLESPSNPFLRVADIRQIVSIVRKFDPEIIIAIDNTFLTPALQKPLLLGVDITVMSCTKYMGGHHDVIMGCLVTNSEDLHKRLYFLQTTLGAVPCAFDCYQMYRSTKTLALRMERHSKSGLIVAEWLEKHPKVIKVNHPMLASNPQRELFMSQAKGHSGMITFVVAGTAEKAKIFVMALKNIIFATSLGGVATTIALPLSMFAYVLDEEAAKKRGLTPNLVRLSVGIEEPEDIIADLEQALQQI